MNGGLVLMIALSLLPIGLMQAWASIEYGMWYARSAEFLQQPVMEVFRWLRTIGDTIFLVGVGALAWFVIGLKTGWSYVSADRSVAAAVKPARAGRHG
jgi:nitric oxide reductase subunit B